MIKYPLACVLFLVFCVNAQAQNRMPQISPEQMSEAQKKAAAEYMAARGPLTGPWIAILRGPDMLNRARALSDYLRFNSSLPPRLSEFVILITARQWAQPYEWNAHHTLALKKAASIRTLPRRSRRAGVPDRWRTMRKLCTTSARSCMGTTA